jgi:hypothetical protein
VRPDLAVLPPCRPMIACAHKGAVDKAELAALFARAGPDRALEPRRGVGGPADDRLRECPHDSNLTDSHQRSELMLRVKAQGERASEGALVRSSSCMLVPEIKHL